MKVFLGGISLGGGLAACLCVQRPTFFEGVVLVAPMLFVSDEIKPPVFVQKLFRWIVAPLLPRWPIAPVKDMEDFDFRVPSHGHRFCAKNPLSMQGLKARLGSACSLGFTFPDWMEGHLRSVRTPLLILHGDADKVTDPALSKRLHQEAPASDKTLKIYEGAFHCELMSCLPGLGQILGEDWLPEQAETTQRCLGDIAEWLAARA
uniref:Serine aminopeptidase S33 domain-containing protein n=1 Tax=Alexandrium catenella TaxID=2925 RepID=A0A7S1WQU5_ALECA